MMLLHLLLHVLVYYFLTAREIPKSKGKLRTLAVVPKNRIEYIVQYVKRCSELGYYITREVTTTSNSLEPPKCYLCLCHDINTAVCWQRENTPCSLESFYYYDFGKRDTTPPNNLDQDNRIRRSSDKGVFYRGVDDVFKLKLNKHQCEPFQASVSDDCPPADLCKGCTVCDCGADGRWNCNHLKFCPDKKKDKDFMKKLEKTTVRPKKVVPSSKKSNIPMKHLDKSHKRNKKQVLSKSFTTGKDKSKKKKQSLQYQIISNKCNTTVMIIKKNIGSHNPIEIKGNKIKKIYKKHDNNTMMVSQQVKKTIVAVNQNFENEHQNMAESVDERHIRFPRTTNDLDAVKSYKNILETKIRPRGIEKRLIKRHLNYQHDPLTWRGRYKRAASSIEKAPRAVNSSSTLKEDKPLPLQTVPATLNVNTTTTFPAQDYFEAVTVIPMLYTPSNVHYGNDYYKYDIATENESNLTPKENKLKTEIKVTPVENEILNIRLNKINISTLLGTANSASNYSELTINKRVMNESKPYAKAVSKSEIKDINNAIDSFKYLSYLNPEVNDIHFFKWPQFNFDNHSDTKKLVGKLKNIVKLIPNKTTTNKNNKIFTKDIGRATLAKKFNLVKIVKPSKCPFLNTIMNENYTTTNETDKKIKELHHIFAKLLKEYNGTAKRLQKTKKFNAIKYWRKILSKMYDRNILPDHVTRNHITQTLCENFGPCSVSANDTDILRAKIAQLDLATGSILRIVKINKGLLRLLDSREKHNESSVQDDLQIDIRRFNSILKGTYGNWSKEPLNKDQLVQIKLIKKNTQDFVKSVGKFTILLHETINILTKGNNTNDTVENHKIKIHEHHKPDSFQSLKLLLTRYNSVQSNLLKKIFDFLNYIETHNKTDKTLRKSYKKYRDSQNLAKTENFEKFTKNIISNIRKLKKLAHTFNASRSCARCKRDVDDERNNMEYLLTLMEYLLKKQPHTMRATPVNDGIDLLIEAIKNAPEIKTVTKKVLPITPPSIYINDTKMRANDGLSSENLLGYTEDTHNGEKIDVEDTQSNYNSNTDDDADENIEIKRVGAGENGLKKEPDQMFEPEKKAKFIPNFITSTTVGLVGYSVGKDNILSNANVFHYATPSNIENDNLNVGIKETDDDSSEDEGIDEGHKNNHLFIDDATTEGFIDDVKYVYGVNESTSDLDEKLENIEDNNKFKSDTINVFTVKTFDIDNTTKKNTDDLNKASDSKLNYGKANDNDNDGAFDGIATSNSIDHVTEKSTIQRSTERMTRVVTEEAIQAVGTVHSEYLREESSVLRKPERTYKPALKNPKRVKYLPFKSLDTDAENIDKKTKLEWIVENFGTEVKLPDDEKYEDKNLKSKEMSAKATTPNVSSESAEIILSKIKKNGSVTNKNENSSDLLLKKQMSFLNYLDYGTDKGEFDESVSKDGNVDEKYADTFSSYFL